MIRLRDAVSKEVVELDPTTKVRLIDGLHYVETQEVRMIGAWTELQSLRAFEMVQVDTGLIDDEQPRVMAILPRRSNGVAALIASMVVGLSTLGCSGPTYHYSYTCYGNGCEPMPRQMSYHMMTPAPVADVIYVDRPVELRVRRDRSSFVRRAALPRRSK